MDAYRYATQLREKASELCNTDLLTPEIINKSLAILDSAIEFLDQPRIVELAKDDSYLFFRKSNILRDKTILYAYLKDTVKTLECITALSKINPGDSFAAEIFENDPRFDFVKDLPTYKQLINKLFAIGKTFDNSDLLTSYSPNMPNELKIAGLSLFWNEIKNKFVYFDHIPNLDWNKVYLEKIKQVMETTSTKEYYYVLQKMCALLKDGHTQVFPPSELKDSISARPALRTMLVNDKVVIWKVMSDSLSKLGFRLGQEVLAINDIPVHEYSEKYVKPYVSSSTEQDLNVRTYNYFLFSGDKSKSIKIKIKDENGIATKILPRKEYKDIKANPIFEYKKIDNISYIALNSFEKDSIKAKFHDKIKDIIASDGLILDLRYNGGGSTNNGINILNYLTSKPYKIARSEYRVQNFSFALRNKEPRVITPGTEYIYNGPVILLIGNMTFSAAEDFVMIFDAMHRGQLIGEPTGGSTGESDYFLLPGGIRGRVCTKRDFYPDGKEFVGVGIKPHILVKPTIQDIAEGSDPVLNKALEILKKK